jgi:hypothetical protein
VCVLLTLHVSSAIKRSNPSWGIPLHASRKIPDAWSSSVSATNHPITKIPITQVLFKLREEIVPMKMYRGGNPRFARVVLIRFYIFGGYFELDLSIFPIPRRVSDL